MFHYKFINGKKVLYSDLLPEAEHFFTTREAVIKSDEPNLQPIIVKNKIAILSHLNVGNNYLKMPIQTHSANVRVARANINSYPKTDAMIVDNNRIAVALNFADCCPIILYDRVHNVGAIVHAGWKGTFGKIVVKTIEKMFDEYLISPQDLVAIIGPTIGKCCYGLGEDVYDQLATTIDNISDYSEKIQSKYYVDLKQINKQQLLNVGLSAENIDVSTYCTSCNNDLFFSFRKEKTTSRHSAVLKLK